jgi:hypothetical protein
MITTLLLIIGLMMLMCPVVFYGLQYYQDNKFNKMRRDYLASCQKPGLPRTDQELEDMIANLDYSNVKLIYFHKRIQ